MSDPKAWWQKSRRLAIILSTLIRHLFRQLTARNLKILWKAIRQEPPDLILANIIQLLKTGRGQSPYAEKFLATDEVLKVQLQDCRKENGVLTVVVWVLARARLQAAALYAGTKKLGKETHIFQKPEYSAFFAECNDFEQQGLIFKIHTQELLPKIHLQLIDQNAHQVILPVGPLFLYNDAQTEIPLRQVPAKAKRLLLLLHDWGLPLGPSFNFASLHTDLSDYLSTIIVCTNPNRRVLLPDSEAGEILQLPFELVNEYLHDQDFDGVLLLTLDTVLPIDFLADLSAFSTQNPLADLIYFDEDLQENPGQYHSPILKPEFSPERLAADNYIGANFFARKTLGASIAWFSQADQLSGGYDFLLRSLEHAPHCYRLPDARIHLPDYDQTSYKYQAEMEHQIRQAHYTKLGWTVFPGITPGSGEVLRPLVTSPLVSIIIPFKDQVKLLERCLQSILSKTHYPHFEVLLVSNNSEEAATYRYLEQCNQLDKRFRWLRWDHPFNYSALNNWAAQQAQGELLLLLNNDIEIITEGWLGKLLSYLQDPAVGAVGAKLLYPDDTVQHAGIIMGFGGIAAHAHKHYPDAFGGYNDRANKVQNVSACTAACLLVKRALFEAVQGFDALHLPIAFNDVDLCLKIRGLGYRIVYTPFVKLYHYESISRGAEDTPAKRKRARREVGFFRKKWQGVIQAGDPYYHPGFSLRLSDFETKC